MAPIEQTFADFLTPGSDETVISGAALSGGNPAAQAFSAEYNSSGIKTNLIIPLTQVGSGNNAGMKNVVGGSGIQTTQNPISSSGNVESSANMGFQVGIGWWIGFDQGIPKLFIGDENGDSMSWDGDSLDIVGSITATTGMIGGFTITADSLTATSGGNTVTLSTGTNSFISGPTGAPNAIINTDGYATFIGVSTLNKKAYTNFEGGGRFVNTTTAGTSIAPSYGNQGVTLDTTATADRFSRILWFVANVFTNNPTFVTTLVVNAAPPGTGELFVGLGQPTVAGTGHSFANKDFIGFYVENDLGSSTMSIYGMANTIAFASPSSTSRIETCTTSDTIELFFHVFGSSVTYYVRKNGGNLVNGGTVTTHIPTGAGESSVQFSVSNANVANDTSIIIQCAAYEH